MYRSDRDWGDSYEHQVTAMLTRLLPHLAKIEVAPTSLDQKCATDFTLTVTGGHIAVRLRRATCGFRDFTLRALRDNGTKTELQKIKEGYAFRYFYGWTDYNRKIAEWMLVNLDTLRSSGLLDKPRKFIDNRDGTHFLPISIPELREAGCLMAEEIIPIENKRRNVNTRVSLEDGIKRADIHYPRLPGQ